MAITMKPKFMAISAIIVGLAAITVIASFSYVGQQSELVTTFGISSEELEKQIKTEPHLVMIDIRNTDSYMSGHIKGSTVDGLSQEETFDKRISTMHSRIPEVIKNTKFVLVDGVGSSSTETIAQKMTESGLETQYLQGGIQSWNGPKVIKESKTIISSEDLWKKIQVDEDVYLLDVRQPEELDVTKISGSANVPLAEIFEYENVKNIPDDKPVVIICGSGNRATIASYELAKYGIDFQVLEDGIKSWDAYLEDNSLDKI